MYDTRLGQWKYHRIRSDKDRGNFIDVVMSIFIEQAENISIEELQYELEAEGHQKNGGTYVSFQERLRMSMQAIVGQSNMRWF